MEIIFKMFYKGTSTLFLSKHLAHFEKICMNNKVWNRISNLSIVWWFVDTNESNLPSFKTGVGVGIHQKYRSITNTSLNWKIPYPSSFLPKHYIRQLGVNGEELKRDTLWCKFTTVLLKKKTPSWPKNDFSNGMLKNL